MTPSSLHSQYVALTGLQITFTMARNFAWEQWQFHGWTPDDLAMVVRWLQKKNKRGGNYSLKFSRLIENTSHFEECLSEARAESRVTKMPRERASALRSTGRSDVLPTAECIQAGQRAVELLRTFRAAL